MAGLREVLRGLPVLTGVAPPFDPARAPADPVELFAEWLLHAIDARVIEPHAMTVSTVDATSQPNAQVLICKDVDAGAVVADLAVAVRVQDLARRSRSCRSCSHGITGAAAVMTPATP